MSGNANSWLVYSSYIAEVVQTIVCCHGSYSPNQPKATLVEEFYIFAQNEQQTTGTSKPNHDLP